MTTLLEIPAETAYVVIDIKTKQVVYRTTYANRTRARSKADRLDLEYGACRYRAQVEDMAALHRLLGVTA